MSQFKVFSKDDCDSNLVGGGDAQWTACEYHHRTEGGQEKHLPPTVHFLPVTQFTKGFLRLVFPEGQDHLKTLSLFSPPKYLAAFYFICLNLFLVGRKLGFTEIKFIRRTQKTVSGAQKAEVHSHLLMPAVTADRALLIRIFHQSGNTFLCSSAWGCREGLGGGTVFPTAHLFSRLSCTCVLLTLLCSVSSGMQRLRARNQGP